jgi:hypothetical protein
MPILQHDTARKNLGTIGLGGITIAFFKTAFPGRLQSNDVEWVMPAKNYLEAYGFPLVEPGTKP